MIVKNVTNRTIVSLNCKFASSSLDRALGLLRKSNPRSLLIETRFGVHTFGLSIPIDVLVLDDERIVQSVKVGLKPNRTFFWNPKYSLILELPAGTIKKSKTEIGDKLEIPENVGGVLN